MNTVCILFLNRSTTLALFILFMLLYYLNILIIRVLFTQLLVETVNVFSQFIDIKLLN